MILNPTACVFCTELAILETKYSRFHIRFLPYTNYIWTFIIARSRVNCEQLMPWRSFYEIASMGNCCLQTKYHSGLEEYFRLRSTRERSKVSSCTMPKKSIVVLLGLVVGNEMDQPAPWEGHCTTHNCYSMCLMGLQPTISLSRHQCSQHPSTSLFSVVPHRCKKISFPFL